MCTCRPSTNSLLHKDVRRCRGSVTSADADATLSRKHWLKVPGSGARDKEGEESCHTSHTIEGPESPSEVGKARFAFTADTMQTYRTSFPPDRASLPRSSGLPAMRILPAGGPRGSSPQTACNSAAQHASRTALSPSASSVPMIQARLRKALPRVVPQVAAAEAGVVAAEGQQPSSAGYRDAIMFQGNARVRWFGACTCIASSGISISSWPQQRRLIFNALACHPPNLNS